MTKEKSTRSSSDGKNEERIFGVSELISVENSMTCLSCKFTAAAEASAANQASAAISSTVMTGYENQSLNRILTIKATAVIVAAIAIAKRIANLERDFARIIWRLFLTCSICSSVLVNDISNIRQGTITFRRHLLTSARRSLSRKNFTCVSTYRTYKSRTIFWTAGSKRFLHQVRNRKNWREDLQKFVCKYPFRGGVRIYEDSNIFIFLVLKESVLKETLLAQIESFVLIIENNN